MISAFAFREVALRLAPGAMIAGWFIAMSASVALWPLVNGLAGALALIALTGALEGPSLVALISVRQSLAPPHLRGQIFTVSSLNLAAIAGGVGVGRTAACRSAPSRRCSALAC